MPPTPGENVPWGFGEILVEDQIDTCIRVVMTASLRDCFLGGGGADVWSLRFLSG